MTEDPPGRRLSAIAGDDRRPPGGTADGAIHGCALGVRRCDRRPVTRSPRAGSGDREGRGRPLRTGVAGSGYRQGLLPVQWPVQGSGDAHPRTRGPSDRRGVCSSRGGGVMRRMIIGLVVVAALTFTVLAGAAGAAGRADELAAVRNATAKFHDFHAATAAGYGVFYVCTDETGQGAMGQHYVNGGL